MASHIMATGFRTARPGTPVVPNEILDLIVETVREQKFKDWYPELRTLSLVSSGLRPRAQRRLFRTLLVDFCSSLNSISKLAEAFAQNPLLPKYVEKFTMVNVIDDDEICGLKERYLYDDHQAECRDGQEAALAGILTAIGRGGQLKELQFFGRAHPQHFQEEVFDWVLFTKPLQEAIEGVCASSSRLEALVVVNGFNIPIDILCHPHLRTLKLLDASIATDTEWPEAPDTPGNLKTLILACPSESVSNIGGCTAINDTLNLSSLESLTVDSCAKDLLNAIIDVAGGTIKHLRIFAELGDGVPNFESIAKCPGLVTFEVLLDSSPIGEQTLDPFGGLAALQVPRSLETFSITFRIKGVDSPPIQGWFMAWAKHSFPTLDRSLSRPQWRALQNLDIVVWSEPDLAASWFSDLDIPTTFMPGLFGRGLVRSLTRTHEDMFSSRALFERPEWSDRSSRDSDGNQEGEEMYGDEYEDDEDNEDDEDDQDDEDDEDDEDESRFNEHEG